MDTIEAIDQDIARHVALRRTLLVKRREAAGRSKPGDNVPAIRAALDGCIAYENAAIDSLFEKRAQVRPLVDA